MNATTKINQRLQLLPSELQEEVLQFIDYLLFKKKTSESKPDNGKVSKDEINTKNEEPTPGEMDYREFWGVIQPPMGLEKIDRLIAEMRED